MGYLLQHNQQASSLSASANLQGSSHHSPLKAHSSGKDGTTGDASVLSHTGVSGMGDEGVEGGWIETSHFSAILLGKEHSGHNYDKEKQEILVQINQLEYQDRLTLIVSCQFTLHVYYSRAIMMYLFRWMSTRMPQSLYLTTTPVGSTTDATLSLYTKLLGGSLRPTLLGTITHAFTQYIKSSPPSNLIIPESEESDPSSRIPLCPPFTHLYDTGEGLKGAIDRLQGRFYEDYQADLCVEGASIAGIQQIQGFLRMLIKLTCTSDSAPTPTSEEREHTSRVQSVVSHVNVFLHELVLDSLRVLESFIAPTSSAHVHQGDVISTALSSALPSRPLLGQQPSLTALLASPNSSSNQLLSLQQPSSSSTSFLCSYFLIRTLLTIPAVSDLVTSDSGLSLLDRTSSSAHSASTVFTRMDPPPHRFFAHLLSIPTVTGLLKACRSPNISIKFCAFDLLTLILSLINTIHIPPTVTAESTPLEVSAIYEGYVRAITKHEKTILQSLTNRMLTESQSSSTATGSGLYSRYTRVLIGFMMQYKNLQRRIGSTESNRESSDAYISGYITSPINLVLRQPINRSAVSGEVSEECLRVMHVTSQALTIQWSTKALLNKLSRADDDDVGASECSMYIVVVSDAADKHLNLPRFVSKLALNPQSPRSNTDDGLNDDCSVCISNLVADTLYRVFVKRDDAMTGQDTSSTSTSPTLEQSTSSSNNTSVELCYILASTLTESLITLDPLASSSSLQLSGGLSTVRNCANKHWSTVRAKLKMVGGVHRWDIRIDR